MQSVEYDIAVIGAGPAGSFAARYAAEARRRVLLIDQHEFPRDKVCGDGLNPRSCVLLTEAGIDAGRLADVGAVRIEGHRKFRDGQMTEEPIVARPGWADHAYALPRHALDRLLWTEALSRGAEWLGGCRVRAVDGHRSNRHVMVRGEHHGRTMTISARLAIIASGALATYYRPLGGVPARSQGAIAGGLRQYFELSANAGATFDFYYHPSLPDGYGWVFPVGDKLVNAGVWARNAAGPRRLRAAFAAFVDSGFGTAALRSARALGKPCGAPLRPMLGPRLAGDGLLWAGEAAGLVHRETGQGISYALESGRQAALAAHESLGEDTPDQTPLRRYDEWVRRSFEQELLSWTLGK